jgi:sugar phosphate isomerase/epimerase
MNRAFFAVAAVAATTVACTTVETAAPKATCPKAACEKCEKCEEAAPRPPSPSCGKKNRLPFKLGVARYSMHRHSYERALEILQNIDCHYMGLIDKSIPRNASDAQIKAHKEHCAKYGVEVVSLGPVYYSTEKEIAEACEFAKRYGMKYISVVPFEWNPKLEGATTNEQRAKKCPPREWRLESDKMMDLLEKYCLKYDLKAAVHNHGPDNAYLYPTADSALKRIGNRDKRLGVCLDVGHQRRAGLDPVEFIKKHSDRIVEVHMKNIEIDRVKNLAKEGPRGELDIPGIMQALADVGFSGYCLVEFEKDFKQNEAPLAESFGYYRGVMDCTRVKTVMKPVPANANTLTAAEKAEGWSLLFDGVKLPDDVWVGYKSEWLEKGLFPKRGWYVKDGCLTMRPVSGISPERTWFPLPPEDARQGGGGDIMTRKKYSDFIFKFDFRLTKGANSGIKYFFNEGMHKNSTEEYQVLENFHPDSDKGADGNRKCAALYDILPAKEAQKVLKGAGEWNSGMIVSKGNHVEHWLNGVKVLEYERGSKAFRAAVAKSKYHAWQDKGKFWGEEKQGRILIQDHSDSTVSYCNLKIKAL